MPCPQRQDQYSPNTNPNVSSTSTQKSSVVPHCQRNKVQITEYNHQGPRSQNQLSYFKVIQELRAEPRVRFPKFRAL